MNILLTGEPRVGKTSLLQQWLAKQQNAYGFLTIEVRREHKRMGLACVASDGVRTHFADVDVESTTRIGRYGIDIPKLDGFFANVEKLPKSADLLYLDEIGQMQLLTPVFMKLATEWLNDLRPLVGTISAIFEHPFIKQVQARPDTVLCHVSATSKDQLRSVLEALKMYALHEQALSENAQHAIQKMAKQYAANQQYTYLKKLLASAATYLAEDRVKPTGQHTWSVLGNHARHTVSSANTKLTCECDLFCGREHYAQLMGDCSHVQATKLYLLSGGNQ